jgi:hypothetical protein
MERNKYYITFGQLSAFRSHYLIVYADRQQTALKYAEDKYKHISSCYEEKEFEEIAKYFPAGILEIIK